ncbi:hypothetical protein D3C76_1764370 [compost metagenome]
MRADMFGQFVGLDHLVGLVQFIESATVGLQDGDASWFNGGLIFAAMFHLAIDAVAFNQLF